MSALTQELPNSMINLPSYLGPFLGKNDQEKDQPQQIAMQVPDTQNTQQKSTSELLRKLFGQENSEIFYQDQDSETILQAQQQKADLSNKGSLNQKINCFVDNYIKKTFPMLNEKQQQEFKKAVAPNIEKFTQEVIPLFTELAAEEGKDPVQFHKELDQELVVIKNMGLAVEAATFLQLTQQTLKNVEDLRKKEEQGDAINEQEYINVNEIFYILSKGIHDLFERTMKGEKIVNDLLADEQKKATAKHTNEISKTSHRQAELADSNRLGRILKSLLSIGAGIIQLGIALCSAAVPVVTPLLIASAIVDIVGGVAGLIVEAIPMSPELREKLHLGITAIQAVVGFALIGSLVLKIGMKLGIKTIIRFATNKDLGTTGRLANFLYGGPQGVAREILKRGGQHNDLPQFASSSLIKSPLFSRMVGLTQAGVASAQTGVEVHRSIKQFDLSKMQYALRKMAEDLTYITQIIETSFAGYRTVLEIWEECLSRLIEIPEQIKRFMQYAANSLAV